jgi:hypothetical protein
MGLACLDLEFGLVGFAFALGHGGDPSSPGQGHMYCTIDGERAIRGTSGHAMATQDPTAGNVHMK